MHKSSLGGSTGKKTSSHHRHSTTKDNSLAKKKTKKSNLATQQRRRLVTKKKLFIPLISSISPQSNTSQSISDKSQQTSSQYAQRSFGGLLPSCSKLLSIAMRGMKYVPYQDNVEVPRYNKPATPPTSSSSTTTTTTTTPPPTAATTVGADCYDFSSYPTPSQPTTPTRQTIQRPTAPGFGSTLRGGRPQPKLPQIDNNPLYQPLSFHTTNNTLRNSPLLRTLDTDKLLFQTTNFLFLGPKDSQIESLAYLFGQQCGSPVKYLNHKNCSQTLEDIVVNVKDYVLWSDIPDIVDNTELATILPTQHMVTVYLDYPATKVRFSAQQQTREALIQSELVGPGHLEATHPILNTYKLARPDPNSPITSDTALNHPNLWQFDGVTDYRIMLTEGMSPNEIFDRVHARIATSDAYITTRNEFTSESNAATQERIQKQNEEGEGQGGPEMSNYNPMTGETEVVRNRSDHHHNKSGKKKLVKRTLPDGREVETYEDDDDGDNTTNHNNIDTNGSGIKGDDKEGLFELNSFLNVVVSPVAKHGGLFVPDMPSPYLLNQHHMFDVDDTGDVLRYPEDLAQRVVDHAHDQIENEEMGGANNNTPPSSSSSSSTTTPTNKSDSKSHPTKHQNVQDVDEQSPSNNKAKQQHQQQQQQHQQHDDQGSEDPYDQLASEDLEPEFSGSVNQMHLFPQTLRRMVELNYLQRLQRVIEGFPFAGIRPSHVSQGLAQHFFSFNNESVISTASFDHLSKANRKPVEEVTVNVRAVSDNKDNKTPQTTTTTITRPKTFSDIPLTQSGQPSELPPFPRRPTYFLELYHSDQGLYDDVRSKITQSLLHSAQLFEQNMRTQGLKQQRTMAMMQTGRTPPDSELHHPPSVYDRFAMMSSGTPEFTLSAVKSTDTTLVPHLVMVPIRSKGVVVPRSDTTKSSTHLNRGLLSTAWSPLQYLQFYSALQVRDPRIVPIGVTYYESRALQQIAHQQLKNPFKVHLEAPLNQTHKSPDRGDSESQLFPGETSMTRLIRFGTMNSDSFPSMIGDISIFTHGYLELVKQGLVQLPPDRNSEQVQEQIKAGMGFTSLYGLNKDEEGNLLNINRYVKRITPHLYPHYSSQHLSQWDQPVISPIRPELQTSPTRPGAFTHPTATLPPASLTPVELTAANIHTFFKPSVVDVVIPLTDIAMLPAAIMSRDMGTPIRQFVLAVDDKHKFLADLFTNGKIPGISKRNKGDVWHLRREDITALERFFYLICGRDAELVPNIINHLEFHYTASLYVHDPNRVGEEKRKKARSKQEAAVALGPDATPTTKPVMKKKNNGEEGEEATPTFRNKRQINAKKYADTLNDTPSKGMVVDIGEDISTEASTTIDQNQTVVDTTTIVDHKPTHIVHDVDESPIDQTATPNHTQVVPIKRRRRREGDHDDDDSEGESEDQSTSEQSEDYLNEVSESTEDTEGSEGDDSEEVLEDEDIITFMLEDPEVEPKVKDIIHKMLRQKGDEVKDVSPTNADIDLFQKAFFQKEEEYRALFQLMREQEQLQTNNNKKKITDGEVVDVEGGVELPKDNTNDDNLVDLQKKRFKEQIAPESMEYQEVEEDTPRLQFDRETMAQYLDPTKATLDDPDASVDDWEDEMVVETEDFYLPAHIKNILQSEFIFTHVPKKFMWETVRRSLKENGRILDTTSALALAATALNPLAVENASLDLDDYYDAVLDHSAELRGEPKTHRKNRVTLYEEDNSTQQQQTTHSSPQPDPSMDINELIKQFDGTSQIPTTTTTPSTPELKKAKTHYPMMEIPLLIPTVKHPFQDYEELCEIFGLNVEKPPLKLSNKDLAVHVLKQMQSIYAHAMSVAKDEGFQLDTTNVSNLNNRTRDLILPPPHQGTLQMLGNVQKFSEKPIRMPIIAPNGDDATKYTNMDFVINDQLMKFLKLKATGESPTDPMDDDDIQQ